LSELHGSRDKFSIEMERGDFCHQALMWAGDGAPYFGKSVEKSFKSALYFLR
jgi:hypothetical protein